MTGEVKLRKRKDKDSASLDVTINVTTAETNKEETEDYKKDTDINGSPTKRQTRMRQGSLMGKSAGFTLWDVLLSELNLSSEKVKDTMSARKENANKDESSDSWRENMELLLNYVRLPLHLEKFMTFGIIYSIVVFLKWLVIIPLRCFVHTLINIRRLAKGNKFSDLNHGKSSLIYKNDLLSVSGIIITLFLLRNLDTSRIYHNIRSGTAIKLYFMTQVLDIADRLLSASGQDILKVTYRFNSLKNTNSNKISLHKLGQFVLLFTLTILYLWFHSYALVYQVMALNVAINSYSNALLTLILSNQFSELKSAVFKKTEREGLFQVSCSDLNERFFIFIMLAIISSRNLLQILINTRSISDFFDNLKPNSWSTQLTSWKLLNDWIGLLIGPSIFVIGSEFLVDWLKYAYILRFNRIKPKIFDKFTKILANDFIRGFTTDKSNWINHQPNDHPNFLTKRTGFPISTATVIFCKLALFPYFKYQIGAVYEWTNNSHIWSWIIISSISTVILTFLVSTRLILSMVLLKWSRHILYKQHQSSQNVLQIYKTDYIKGDPNVNLGHVADVREQLYDQQETVPPSLGELRMKKLQQNRDDKLDRVVRFEMADKRIW